MSLRLRLAHESTRSRRRGEPLALLVKPAGLGKMFHVKQLCGGPEMRDPALGAEWLEPELRWLWMHLPSPACLRDEGNERAICWFKSGTKRAIEKVRGIVAMLEAKGVPVEMVTTEDAGTIIYEDRWQVVAKPRRQRPARKNCQTNG